MISYDSHIPLLLPTIFAGFEVVKSAQSTRHGGVSKGVYTSLNLGKSTDDDLRHVMENRRRFCTALGFEAHQMAWSKQVHGDQVRIVNAPGGAEGFDALITQQTGILLAVSIADCTPILVFDAKNVAIAAIHAGWKGTEKRIVTKTLQMMADEYGTQGVDCRVFIGACIDECSFEVDNDVAMHFDNRYKVFDSVKNKYLVNLKQANADYCRDFGVPETQIEISQYSTVLHNEHFFSHRKEKGHTGRMLAAIGILSASGQL